jgi:hypothetical protein
MEGINGGNQQMSKSHGKRLMDDKEAFQFLISNVGKISGLVERMFINDGDTIKDTIYALESKINVVETRLEEISYKLDKLLINANY